MDMILVGDVGGTKTLLEVGYFLDARWRPVFGARYAAEDYPDLHSVLLRFFQDWGTRPQSQNTIIRACFGVAGPLFGSRVKMTNLSWMADADAISAEFNIPNVRVVNDFFAAASGIEMLSDEDIVALQAGEPVHDAPRLVIGAGTGLGVAYLIKEGGGYKVIAGEAGHAAFSPTTLEQVELWHDLSKRFGRVSAEDVVSGPGLQRIYEFIARKEERHALQAGIIPSAIARAAIEFHDPIALRALDLFIACYGEVAGNHALAVLARGGVYIAGGIAPKILSRLQEGGFLAAFNAKAAHCDTLQKIPVSVVTNERLGILGCALIAARESGR